MKRMKKWAVSALAAGLAAGAGGAMAATGAEVNQAIEDGLAYLSGTQDGLGRWTSYGGLTFAQATTGSVVFAMLSQQAHWGANAAAYQGQVDLAMNYLLSVATKGTVSTRQGNAVNICPGGVGTCTAVWWPASGEDTYASGLIAQAVGLYAQGRLGDVATGAGPLAGMTWGDIAQNIVNAFAAGQVGVDTDKKGGWRYPLPQSTDADSSTTQWGVLALTYMQALGATVPGVTKTDLTGWLSRVQAASGVACYQPNASPCDHADTGALLLGLDFVGKPVGDPQIQLALNWLNANWTQTAGGTWFGNFGQPYAMWSLYKGLEVTIGLADNTEITNLFDSDCSNPPGTGVPEVGCNWWQDYNEYLVRTQNGDGSWGGYAYWTGPMAAAFFLPILGGTEIPIPEPMPEPGTLALLAVGLVGLAASRRRRAS